MGTGRLPGAAVFGVGAALVLVIFGVGFAFGEVAALRRVPPVHSPAASDQDPYPTYTVLATGTPSPVPSPTGTPGPRSTAQPTVAPSPTEPPTPVPTATPSPVPTATPTPGATETSAPATTSLQFQVAARRYYAADVSLKAGATLSGSFSVQPEDINFAIWITSPSRARLYARNRARGTYAFAFVVPATGQYALVFDNTYSPRSAKTVALTYTIEGP